MRSLGRPSKVHESATRLLQAEARARAKCGTPSGTTLTSKEFAISIWRPFCTPMRMPKTRVAVLPEVLQRLRVKWSDTLMITSGCRVTESAELSASAAITRALALALSTAFLGKLLFSFFTVEVPSLWNPSRKHHRAKTKCVYTDAHSWLGAACLGQCTGSISVGAVTTTLTRRTIHTHTVNRETREALTPAAPRRSTHATHTHAHAHASRPRTPPRRHPTPPARPIRRAPRSSPRQNIYITPKTKNPNR